MNDRRSRRIAVRVAAILELSIHRASGEASVICASASGRSLTLSDSPHPTARIKAEPATSADPNTPLRMSHSVDTVVVYATLEFPNDIDPEHADPPCLAR
jgi:hypothetical protein